MSRTGGRWAVFLDGPGLCRYRSLSRARRAACQWYGTSRGWVIRWRRDFRPDRVMRNVRLTVAP